MRVMTYNILDGGLSDHGYDRWPAIVEVIGNQCPDVLILNECNRFEQEGRRRFYELERALGLQGVLGEARTGYHVAVYCRPGAVVRSQLSTAGFHHACLAVEIEWKGQRVTVVAAHLCPFSAPVRLIESQYLVNFAHLDQFVLIAGDMNSISPHDASAVDTAEWSRRQLMRHLLPTSLAGGAPRELDTSPIRTLEAGGLVDLGLRAAMRKATIWTPLRSDSASCQLRVDYIFATPPLAERLSNAWVVDGEPAASASDHYPVCAELAL